VKKIENEKDKHLRRFSHLYAPLSSAESSFVETKNTKRNEDYKTSTINQNTNKKEIILKNSQKKSSILNENSLSAESSADSSKQKNDYNYENAASQNEKSYEAQNQLKFYIKSLEKKLANLRTEMKDSTVLNQSNQNNSTKKPDRFLHKETILNTYGSNESIDSIKETVNANDVKQIYSNGSEFNLKEYFDKKDMNFNIKDQKFMTPNLSPASTFAESSEEINGSPDTAALKKSLHKSNGADSLFDRVKAVSATLAHSSSFTNHQNKSNAQISKFTPILNDKVEDSNSNSRSETSFSDKNDNFCIKNPIPIRYSSTTTATTTTGTSSSADSLSHYIKMDKFEAPENLEFKQRSIDEINKKMNLKTDSGRNLGESIVPNSSRSNNVETINKQYDLISKGLNMFKDTASSFRRANSTLNSNQVNPHSVQKTKSLLIVAHENQLSDITETCKEEMGLLMSFKDSQMVKLVFY
jgi:hypothetical protein